MKQGTITGGSVGRGELNGIMHTFASVFLHVICLGTNDKRGGTNMTTALVLESRPFSRARLQGRAERPFASESSTKHGTLLDLCNNFHPTTL